MAKVKFKRIQDSSDIQNVNIEDGSFIITGDGKSYIDYGNERVPTNGTPDTEMSDISHNSVENKVVKKYVDDNISTINDDLGYEVVTSGEWTYKKYNNGLIEMWQRHVGNYTLNRAYVNSTLNWATTERFEFPVTLTALISINTTLGTSEHLIGCNYTNTNEYKTGYNLYIYEYGQSLTNQPISIHTIVIGKWK